MTEQIATADQTSVAFSIVVNADIEHAFSVFTSGFDRWWPREHHIGQAEMREAVLEQKTGGRWYERSVDGSECDWGRVLVFDPPTRLLLSWHLQGDWGYDPDSAHASEIEVHFLVEAPDRTRVELEHRALDRHGAGAEGVRTGVSSPGGWPGLLERYSAAV